MANIKLKDLLKEMRIAGGVVSKNPWLKEEDETPQINVKELVESISKKIKAEPKLLEKVHLISHSLLGSNVQSASEVKFDYKLALDSMCFFDYRDVPRVDDIPKNVSEIKFKSSLENLSPIEKHIIWNNI